MTPPTLLTLPREIRNNTYSHLSKKLQFEWLWAVKENYTTPASTEATLYDIAEVFFDNVPDPAYFEEQELPAEGLSVCIAMGFDSGFSELGPKEDTDARLNETFAKVKHATLDIHLPHSEFDHDALKYLTFFGALLPKLKSLKPMRIIFRQWYTPVLDMQLLNDLLAPGSVERAVGFRPVLPELLTGLRVVQRSEGYRVGYAASQHAGRGGYAAGDVNAHMNPDNLPFVTFHEIRKMGVYMYARPGVDIAKLPFWTAEEVVERFDVYEYPDKVFEGMSEVKIARLKSYALELVQWFEKREAGGQYAGYSDIC